MANYTFEAKRNGVKFYFFEDKQTKMFVKANKDIFEINLMSCVHDEREFIALVDKFQLETL
ncbi:hypothetical protein [Vallitalea okinawensis]|uniref:hypothetical protein n=1 Tax=Vallitalea okinawensis TaxID=2078660 RepID=UPI000CFC19A4|nr:hypothetical protein [Vallitalea okinawensis]